MSTPRSIIYVDNHSDASDKSPINKIAKARSTGSLTQYHVYSIWQLIRLSMLRPLQVLLPRRRGPRLCVLFTLTTFVLLWFALFVRRQDSQQWGDAMHEDPNTIRCISWRSTDWCHPNGKHLPDRDVPCHMQVPDSAGYCECSGGLTIAHVACGTHKFTCADKCSELSVDRSLGKPLPTLMQCGQRSNVAYSSAGAKPSAGGMTATQLQDAGAALAKRASAWQAALEIQRKSQAKAQSQAQSQAQDVKPVESSSPTASSILAAAAMAGRLSNDAGVLTRGRAGTKPAAASVVGTDALAAAGNGGQHSSARSLLSMLPEDEVEEDGGEPDDGEVFEVDVLAEEEEEEQEGRLLSEGGVRGQGAGTQDGIKTQRIIAHGHVYKTPIWDGAAAARANDNLSKLKGKVQHVSPLDTDEAVRARVKRLKRTRASLAAPGTPAYTGFDMAAWAEAVAVFEKQARKLWDDLGGLVRRHSHREDVGRLPGERTQSSDWVADGLRLAPESVGELRANVRRYKDALPGYPSQLFSGRGVVMIAGGLKYMVSAWISLNMLRRTGCTLPVEMWFPIAELPTPELEEELVAQGVIVRTFDQRDLDQSGFTLKVTALLLSSFQEVLFIDADNFAVSNPSVLFRSREYNQTGALLWQDFWAASAAPEIYDILEIPPDMRPTWSHESGQIVVDKSRHWHGLLLCIYLNYYHELYYELLTNFMGKGDKETFAYAMLGVGEQVHTVTRPTDALGIKRGSCELLRDGHLVCRPLFACNTMVQRDPGGGVVFLHSNLNKWTLDLPDSFDDYSRRWQLLASHTGKLPQDFPTWVKQQVGFDAEQVVYNLVRSFRCAPWFDEYYRMRLRRGDTPMHTFSGLHELVEGMDLLDWYRHGLSGSYSGMLSWRGARDELSHRWNGRVKPVWRAFVTHIGRWWRREGPYFVPGAGTGGDGGAKGAQILKQQRRRVIN